MTDATWTRAPFPRGRPENLGLAVDRYCEGAKSDDRGRWLLKAADLAVGRAWIARQARIHRMHRELDSVCRDFEVASRLIVGAGGATVREIGIALDVPFGVPFIAGSALKGLAARFVRSRYAREAPELGADGVAYRALFGFTERDDGEQGLIHFHDGLLLADGPDERPLVVDVLTSHHSEYYTGGGGHPPADWDDPIPNPFLAVRAGARYRVALEPRGGEAARGWARWLADVVLPAALEEEGIGAKTAAGYGRMRPIDATGPRPGERAAAIPRAATAPPAAPVPPRVAAPPVEESWEGAVLVLNRGRGELVAHAGSRKAWAPRGAVALNLSEDDIKRLDGRGELRGVTAMVKRDGGRYVLMGARR